MGDIMTTFRKSILTGAMAFIVPISAMAHTNSVGFLSSASAVTTCVGGAQTPCYDVEIFYGSWHSNNGLAAEGDLALFRQDGGGGETQVVGQSAVGGTQIPFTTAHSQTGTIPNTTTTQHRYATNPSADYSNLQSVFALGANYFFHTNSGLAAAPDSSTQNVYAHQSAVSVGLAPGTYRIDYDGLSGVLSANWTPTGSVGSAIFTLLPNGTVTVPAAAPPSVALSTAATDTSTPFTVTVTFSEPVSGLSLGDFNVGNGSVSNLVMVSAGVYTILVTPTDTTAPVSIDLPATTVIDVDTNPNSASNALNLMPSSSAPGALTPAQIDAIRTIIVTEAVNELRSQLGEHQRFTRGARERFIAGQNCRTLEEERERDPNAHQEFVPECDDGLVTRNNVPFDVTGSAVSTTRGIDLQGSFFGQRGNYEGTYRRIVHGEFKLTGYDDGGVVGTLSGRVAWEKMNSASTMLGYFLGAEVSQSDIDGGFSGTRTAFGVSAGAYYVEEIRENLHGDAFVALGFGMNQLAIGDGSIDVDADYTTASIQAGAAISGELNYEKFDIFPEFSAVYGITQIGDVTLTATDTVDAGQVALAVLRFTPRIVIPLDAGGSVYDETNLRISPSVLCEYTRATTISRECGAGLELELTAETYEKDRRTGGRLSYESTGGSGRASISLFHEVTF